MSKKIKVKLIVRFLQVVIILIPFFLFLWLLNIAWVPSGLFVVEKNVNQTSPYIDRLLPDVRVETPYQETDGDWVQKIIGDPVFFFVHPQRRFSAVETEVRFKNSGLPLVEFGVLADVVTGAYTLAPLQNLIIDNSLWSKIEKDGVILLQREKRFDSLASFLDQMPPRSEIATYHYTLPSAYRISDYQPTSAEQILDISLRGSHEFFTYIKNETLRFSVSFTDVNYQVGEDTVTLVAINESGEPVAEIQAQDDGNIYNSGQVATPRNLVIEARNLPEGVYKIQMKAGDDIFFSSLKTSQQKITFLNKIWLANEFAYQKNERSLNFVTDGKNLKFSTHQATGSQSILIGQKTLDIFQPFTEYLFVPAEVGLVAVKIAKNQDLLVRTNGLFAFSANQYFDPEPTRLTAETNLDRSGLNYIIARYTPPIIDGEWLLAKINLNVENIAWEKNTWKFVFSVPTVEQDNREFLLNSIKMRFMSQPWTFDKILNKIGHYVF